MAGLLPTSDGYSNAGNVPGDGPLRPDGKAVTDLAPTAANLPSTRSSASQKQMPALTLMRDLVAGPEKVRSCGQTYLPKAPGEDPYNYADRLVRSVFFNVVGRTVEGLVGQVYRKDPILEQSDEDAVPPVIVEQSENIDLAGTHFDVFTREVLEDAITAGHAAILVEFPATDGTQSLRDEQQAIRPYWVHIKKENILSWRTTVLNGRLVLTQVVLREVTVVPDGRFGEKPQERYRVLFRTEQGLVGWELLQITDTKQVVVVAKGLYRNQDEIPLVEVTTSGSTGVFESIPPLLDLAYLNVAHYQVVSDYLTSIHKTCVPWIFVAGLEDQYDAQGNKQPLVIGASTAINTSNQDAKAMYVSHDGAALGEVLKCIEGFKSDMATLGIQMLAPQKRSAETLGAKQLDKGTEDSALAVTARGLQDALERALDFHAKYLKLEDGGSVTINRDFDEQAMASDLLTAYVGAVANAGLPPRILLDVMQRHGALPPDADLDAIEAEMEARAAAQAEQERQAMADKMALQQQNKQQQPPTA